MPWDKTLKTLYFLVTVIAIAAAIALTENDANGSPRSVKCKDVYQFRLTKESIPMNSNLLMQGLDCITQGKPLTKLGAQWLILKKSFWRLQDSAIPLAATPSNLPFQIQWSEETWNPKFNHLVLMNLNQLKANNKSDVQSVFTHLEAIFSQLQRKQEDGNFNAKASYGSAWNQYSALVSLTKPLGYHKNWMRDGEWSYLDKVRSVNSQYDQRFNELLKSDPIMSRDWDHLWRIFADINWCYTSCLQNLENKIARSELLMLSHRDLAKKVYESRNPFGACDQLGYRGGHFREVSYSNLLGYENGKIFALIGQSLYLRAIDQSDLSNAFYKGMNGVVRSVSLNAINDFRSFESHSYYAGTLGGNHTLPVDLPRGLTAIDAVYGHPNLGRGQMRGRGLEGVSLYMAEYYFKRKALEDQYAQSETTKSQAFKTAKAETEHLLRRPFFTEITFEPIFLGGNTLKDWVEYLYKVNPSTPYQIFAYYWNTESRYQTIVDAVESFPSIQTLVSKEMKKDEFRSHPMAGRDNDTEQPISMTVDQLVYDILDIFNTGERSDEWKYLERTEGDCFGFNCLIRSWTVTIPKMDVCYVVDLDAQQKPLNLQTETCAVIKLGLIKETQRRRFLRRKDDQCFEFQVSSAQKDWEETTCDQITQWLNQ